MYDARLIMISLGHILFFFAYMRAYQEAASCWLLIGKSHQLAKIRADDRTEILSNIGGS